MEHVHSIIIVKKGNKFLNYFDERWNTYLFLNMKGNNIEEIKSKYKTDDVKFLFDKVHSKYSVPHNENRIYHHYFYEVNIDLDGDYFTLDELLEMDNVKENNIDIINYIKEYYKEGI